LVSNFPGAIQMESCRISLSDAEPNILALALLPRAAKVANASRFSFPNVAEEHWRFTPANRNTAANEAWAESQTLARIATRKFAGMKLSLWSLGAAFAFFCCWTVLSSRI
jgi:hypothetical protein